MKSILIPLFIAAGVFTAGMAQASQELATTDGCMKCHDIDKKKKGPSFKDTAKKYKGKADAESVVFKALTDPKGDHPELKAKPEDIKTVVKWILTM